MAGARRADTAPRTVEVLARNAHARKGGFVGQTITVDLASAKLVVADTNGDGTLDVTDVKDGDRVLVLARIAKGTTFVAPAEGEAAETVPARKLVDKTNPPVDDAEAGASRRPLRRRGESPRDAGRTRWDRRCGR